MKIYTRSGDEGETGLHGGPRVSKASARILAYGEVDELNSVLGWCAAVPEAPVVELRREQSRLLVLGSWLSTPPEVSAATRARLPEWPSESCAVLEAEIDGWEAELEPLANFILPGGCELAARLHVARAVCRRAERALAALAAREPVAGGQLAYLNRLSDWLFVLARAANRAAEVPDLPWRSSGD